MIKYFLLIWNLVGQRSILFSSLKLTAVFQCLIHFLPYSFLTPFLLCLLHFNFCSSDNCWHRTRLQLFHQQLSLGVVSYKNKHTGKNLVCILTHIKLTPSPVTNHAGVTTVDCLMEYCLHKVHSHLFILFNSLYPDTLLNYSSNVQDNNRQSMAVLDTYHKYWL